MLNLQSLAAPLPQDIESYVASGQWEAACAMMDERIKQNIPQMLRERLEVQRFFLERLRADYPLTEEQLVQAVREHVPDFSEDDFRALRDQGWLDSRRIEGRRMYFEDTVASLLKANPSFAERAGKPLSPKRPLLDDAMAQMKWDGGLTMRLQLTTTLQIEDDAFEQDRLYRVHLPIPSPAAQQQDVQVLNVQPNPQHLARESAPQRTAFFEERMRENWAFSATSSFTQQLIYCDPLAPNGQRILYPMAHPPVREDLDPQLPHLAFTPYLQALCRELVGDEVIPVRRAKRFYDFITGQVLYSYVRNYLLIENGAEYAAVNLRGDCGLQALLFIALCRMAGIPARWQSGLYAAPGDAGSHDWAWFYTEAWGWLPVDCSFGGAARRGGNAERREFYFGNLDPYRAVFNHAYMAAFQPERRFQRNDPYDNQSGEIETEDRPLRRSEYQVQHEVKVLS
jgi:transglutaminase-like putative cysteine protease